MELDNFIDLEQVSPAGFNLDERQREILISEIHTFEEIDPSEDFFWNSDYTESAVSYPSEISSTEEDVDFLEEILEETGGNGQMNLRLAINNQPAGDPVLENYGYNTLNFNWEILMPAPVIPTVIPEINSN